jgi:hypothetical protein
MTKERRMLFWVGAVVSGYLGYRLLDWWAPAVVAWAVVALQFVTFQMVFAGRGSGAEFYAFSLLLNVVVYYATFGIGRGIGQRLQQRRKGVR